jgi:hypothetical protein
MEYAEIQAACAIGVKIMFHKIKDVEILPEYMLSIYFENGEKKYYDVKPLFDKWEMFRSLLSVKGLFNQVKVDAGGYGISWNDELDLSCNELYNNSRLY